MLAFKILTFLVPIIAIIAFLAILGNRMERKKAARIKADNISDSNIIRQVAQAGGEISAAKLCMLLNIKVEVAQQRLDELYQKGIFDTDFLDNGTSIYRLVDKSLIEGKRPSEQ
jgi:hypothetical protein